MKTISFYKTILSEASDVIGDVEKHVYVINSDNYPVQGGLVELVHYNLRRPDFEPVVYEYTLDEEAKLTDFINPGSSPVGFLISDRVKLLFDQFKIHPHILYPTKVFENDIPHTYYYIHFLRDFTGSLNYSASIFQVMDYTYKVLDTINVASYQDYTKLRQEIGIMRWISLDKPVFSDDSVRKYDFFRIGLYSMYFLTSARRLVQAIDEQGLTGLRINRKQAIYI